MSSRPRRLSQIRDLIEHRSLRSQGEIVDALATGGITATQATLSRDLRELGVLKGPQGYTLPGQSSPNGHSHELRRAVSAYVLSTRVAGNLVVLRTGPGQASALALEVDRAGPDGVVGSIAGDDTVFVAAASPAKAAKVSRVFEGFMKNGTARR